MYDPRYRLRRPALGESMHAPRPTPGRVGRPEVIRERLVTIPERGEHRSYDTRHTTHTKEPEPNAPQLIRLIRTPYKLEVTRPGRVDDGRVGPDFDRSWEPHGASVRAEFGRARVQKLPRPTREGPFLKPRERATAAAWLNDASADGEEP